MKLVSLKTGQPEELDQEGLANALASGTHVAPGAKALINPTGELVFSPNEDVQDNLTKYGYAIPTQDQLNELNNQQKYGEGAANVVKAGVEGAARGATFGLSDIAERGLGISTPEAMRERRERNPIAATTGEIGGALGSALLAPELSPAGLLSKAGAGVAERLAPEALSEGATLASRVLNSAGQVGARAAGSAIEGMAYGAGQSVTEAALGDPNLTGQKVLANIGYGGFFGGALGGLLKAGEIGIPAALDKAKDALSSATDKMTGKITEGAEGAESTFEPGLLTKGLAKVSSAVTGTPEDEIIDYARKVKSGEVVDLKTLQKAKTNFVDGIQNLYDTLGKATTEASTKIRPMEVGALAESLDPAATAQEIERISGKFDGIQAEFEKNPTAYAPSVGKKLEKIQTTLTNSLEDGTSADHYLALNDAKKQLKEILDKTATGNFAEQESGKLAGEIYDEVQGSLKNPEAWGDSAVRQDAYNSALSKHLGDKESIEQQFMSKQKIGGKNVWQVNRGKVNTFFNNINDDRSIPQQEALKRFFGSAKDIIDEMDKSYQSTPFESFDKDRVSGILEKSQQASDSSTSLIAGQEGMGFGGLQNIVQRAFNAPTSLLGLAAQAILDPNTVIGRLGNLERAAQKSSAAITTASKAIFNPTTAAMYKAIGPIAGELSKDEQEKQYNKRIEQIQEYNTAPTKAIDKLDWVTKDMYHVAPNVSSAMQMTAIKGNQFLSSKIPQPATPKLPFDRPFAPSRMQMIKFDRYYNVVHRPLSALSELKAGKVNPETVETLQTVYPQLYTEMKTELMNSLTSAVAKKQEVPLQRRMAISMFLGQAIDSSTQSIASNQMAIAQRSADKQAEQGALKSTAKGVGNLTLSDRLQTNIQSTSQRERA